MHLKIRVQDEIVEIVYGWENQLGAQKLFMALCLVALERRNQHLSKYRRSLSRRREELAPFVMTMGTQGDGLAFFKSSWQEIVEREHEEWSWWCPIFVPTFFVSGEAPLALVTKAVKYLRGTIERVDFKEE